MAFISKKDRFDALRARLKDNPKALAELDLWQYRDQSDWWLNKLAGKEKKVAAMQRHFLRGK